LGRGTEILKVGDPAIVGRLSELTADKSRQISAPARSPSIFLPTCLYSEHHA
jgi:hypothetical protein